MRPRIAIKGFFILLQVALWSPRTVTGLEQGGEEGQGKKAVIERLRLRDARVFDALLLLAELSDLNLVPTEKAGKKTVSLYLRGIRPMVALESLCKVTGLWYRSEEGEPIRVMTTEEYQKDLLVFREEETRVFTLLHPNAVAVATAIESLYGSRVRLSMGVREEELFPSRLAGGGVGGFGGGGGLTRGDVESGALRSSSRAVGGQGIRGLDSLRGGIRFRPSEDANSRDAFEALRGQQLTAQQIQQIEKRQTELQKAMEEGTEALEAKGKDVLAGIARREPPIYVTLNRQHNLIIIRTSDQRVLKDLELFIIDMDRPTPQVLLEMKILEINLDDSFRSVVDLDFTGGGHKRGPETGQPRNPLLSGAAQGRRDILGLGNFANEGGTLIYQFLSQQVRARIQLLAQENRVNVLATPLILCANDRDARIFVGEERPLVRNFEVQSTTTENIARETLVPITELEEIGTTLIIRPRINADRTLTLELQQEVSSLIPGGAILPVAFGGTITQQPVDTVNTANLFGTIVGKDGMTMAVGGLIRETVNISEQKVPFLGDIPLLGNLFKRKVTGRSRRELILLITPHILITPLEGMAQTRERMKALSIHPYHDHKDRALGTYERKDVPWPGRKKSQTKYLDPIPEPAP